MNAPVLPDGQGSSTRPYLIRALHEWCTDNGYTPYVAVHVDETVQVPAEYVKNGEIVLNVGFEATSALELGNEFIRFRARFGGVARDILVPVDRVVAIYARENGQGMAFPVPAPAPAGASARPAPSAAAEPAVAPPPAAPAAVSPLRLAGTAAPAAAPAPGPRQEAPAGEAPAPGDPPTPGPRPAGSGRRASLTRIK
ncbi:MAG: ClpXP protease specificity-enhancing factor [Rubrivivax sp.]